MAVFCPSCDKKTYNEYECDFCNFEIKESKDKTYNEIVNKRKKKKFMMACDVCGEKIAVKATSCPQCGDTKTKNLVWKIVKIVVLIFIILFIINFILSLIGIAILGSVVGDINKENKQVIKQINQKNMKMIDNINNMKVAQFNIDKEYREAQERKERIRTAKEKEAERKEELKLQRIRDQIRAEVNAKRDLKIQMSN